MYIVHVEGLPSKADLKREVDFINAQFDAKDADLVFCHNDLLCRNIVLQTSRVVFIDFEYGGLNPRAFDIANHFESFAGMLPDYDCSRIANRDFRLNWIRTYLRKSSLKDVDDTQLDIDAKALEDDVHRAMPRVTFYWALWGMVQAQCSNLDFDFNAMARLRLVNYFSIKRNFFPPI